MQYYEINKGSSKFNQISLTNILLPIKDYCNSYTWSIQLIDGVGDITGIIGLSIMDLEILCDESNKGYITDLDTIIEIDDKCSDIIDICVIACTNEDRIPKAYRDQNWEKNCEVIISREDSSLWQLTSKNKQIMNSFCELK